MSQTRSDVPPGTLDLLVLRLLQIAPQHGWGLAVQLEEITEGVFCVNQGSLYPALQRLQRQGRIQGSWRTTENGRRARYYELTSSGQEQLKKERESWARTAGAVERVLEFEAAGP